MWRAVKSFPDLYRDLRDLAREELESPLRLRHPGLLRRGFLSDRYAIYRLDVTDPALHMSDFARRRARDIDDPRLVAILANKYLFHQVLAHAFGGFLPALLGLVMRGRFIPEPGRGDRLVDPSLAQLLGSGRGLVLRQLEGGGGHGLHVLRPARGGGVVHNGKDQPIGDVGALQARLDGYVVTEYLDQHRYAMEIFPGSANTIRMLTLIDVHTDRPFLAGAAHRFGTPASAPADNASIGGTGGGGAGGLSCLVDPHEGTLGSLVWLDAKGRRLESSVHPHSGRQVQGVRVAHWHQAVQLSLDLAEAFPYLPYVGWDFLITPHGPRVIEGNHLMHPGLIQRHRPLLADPRVLDFLAVHGARRKGRRVRA